MQNISALGNSSFASPAHYYERNLRITRFGGTPAAQQAKPASAQALQPVAAPLVSATTQGYRRLDLNA
jgi:hypothetical protein